MSPLPVVHRLFPSDPSPDPNQQINVTPLSALTETKPHYKQRSGAKDVRESFLINITIGVGWKAYFISSLLQFNLQGTLHFGTSCSDLEKHTNYRPQKSRI